MRDLLLLAVFFVVLPVAFFRPWIGVLLWSWISYMNPHRLTWGIASNMPFAKIVAIVTLFGLLFSQEARRPPRTGITLKIGRGYSIHLLQEARWPPRTGITTLLAIFWVWITLTTLSANYPDLAWPEWEMISKIFLMTFVTLFLFQEIKKIRYLVLTIALSIASFGVKSGLAGLFTGFGSMTYAYPPYSFIHDNNDMALALNMVLPLLILLGQEEKRPLLKVGFYAIFGLTALGVLSTFSRGGFIGLCVTIISIFLTSQRKALGIIIMVLLCLFVVSMAPVTWYDRIYSIFEYSQDRSAQGRIEAWTVATKLALDSPVTGGGFRTLQPEIYSRYGYDTVSKERVAHSIYFQVLSEQGIIGFGIFVALIGFTFMNLRRLSRENAVKPGFRELGKLSRAIQTSMIAYVVSGAFLSRAYFDLFYHLIAISAILTKLAREKNSSISEVSEQE